MPVSGILFGFPAVVSWSIGPLTIRGDDIFAVIGLTTALTLLTLWVVIERLWHTSQEARDASDGPAPRDITSLLGSEGQNPPPADMTPVAARTEWLLDDNTLVRMRAVRRAPLRRPQAQSGGSPAANATGANGHDSNGESTFPRTTPQR